MKAVIIGGGIIGLCSAYYLQKSGWQVTVLEKNDLTDNCSFGNAGMISPSHFTPLASPGIISQGIKWMFNAKSPFYIKPTLSWRLANWGIRFIRNANVKNVEHGSPYLRDLSVLSHSLYQKLALAPGFNFAMEEKGILMYFKTEKTRDEEEHLAVKAQGLGLNAEILSKSQVQALEPGLEMEILGAAHYHCDSHLYPNDLMTQLQQNIILQGGEIKLNSPVTGISKDRGRVLRVKAGEGEYEADLFVMTGGAWLPELANMAGISIPLMPGKGYSITNKNPKVRLNIPAILLEARVAITPMNGFMRYGGTMEIAAINDQIHPKRVQGILESIPRYFPGLDVPKPAPTEVWHGFRPCSPDGLPFIGFSKKIKNLLIAGGHSMMGLGLGPATGQIISELANNQHPSVKIDAFHPERFS